MDNLKELKIKRSVYALGFVIFVFTLSICLISFMDLLRVLSGEAKHGHVMGIIENWTEYLVANPNYLLLVFLFSFSLTIHTWRKSDNLQRQIETLEYYIFKNKKKPISYWAKVYEIEVPEQVKDDLHEKVTRKEFADKVYEYKQEQAENNN